MKGYWEDSIEGADRRGSALLGNIYLWYPEPYDTESGVRKEAINARRIPSFRGSPERRAGMVWLWDYEGEIKSLVTR